jgi:hypothetical protein
MAEDKYAPKPDDDAHRVHEIHMDLIKNMQWQNKKEREALAKPKEVVHPIEPEKPTPLSPPDTQVK